MRGGRRRSRPLEEGESYYISMTDMMVGVLFIFIIMLSFLALQYRATTSALTQSKDAQTTALLGIATALQPQPIQAEVDHAHHVVCLPASALVASDAGRRCFAYSADALKSASAVQTRHSSADLINFLTADLGAASAPVHGDPANNALSFAADELFVAGTATLSPKGQMVTHDLAASLADRLPCFAYGAPAATGCTGQKLAVVNVIAQAGFDAFSEAGRQAAALSLQRSVAFHQALTAAQPVLGRLTNAPPGQAGSQPLLRVAAYGQSDTHAPPAGAGQTITVVFQPAP